MIARTRNVDEHTGYTDNSNCNNSTGEGIVSLSKAYRGVELM